MSREIVGIQAVQEIHATDINHDWSMDPIGLS